MKSDRVEQYITYIQRYYAYELAPPLHAHIARCSTLWEVWKPLRRLSNTIWKHNNHISNELVFLGVTETGEILPPGLLALHRIMWKVLIIAWTRVEFENIPISPKNIWNITYRRFVARVRALYAEHTLKAWTARMHNRTPPNPDRINRWMNPIASCEGGGLHWSAEWVKMSNDYGVKLTSWEYTSGATRNANEPDDNLNTTPHTGERQSRAKQAFVRGSVQR